MASTYVNDLRLEEMATGDQSGTWGDTTNVNLELIAEAFSYGTEASFSSDADATTTIADGASDPARSLYLKVTSGASLTATRTLTIAPNTVSKVWIIENATSGSQSINISQGSGANVTIPNGDVKVIYTDGAGAGAAVVDAFTDLNLSGTTKVAGLTTTGDINFGDNDKAVFGAGSDLQIYHNGNNSFIDEVGTGILYIRAATDLRLTNANASKLYANFEDGGASKLYYDGDLKLQTTSTGIQITGDTLVSDDGADDFIKQSVSGTTSTLSFGNTESTGGTAQWSYNRSTGALSGNIGAAAGTNFMTVEGTGKIGFGTDSPDGKVHIFSSSAGTVSAANDADDLVLESSANVGMTLLTGNSSVARIRFGDADSNARGNIFYNHNTDSFGFQTAGSTKLTLTQDGELGLGTTNPSGAIHVNKDGTGQTIAIFSSDLGVNNRNFSILSPASDSASEPFEFSTGNSFQFTIDSGAALNIASDKNIGIGTTSPDTIMEIVGADPILTIRDTDTGQSTANARIRFAESAGGDILDNYWDVGLEPTQSLTFSKNGTEYARFNTNGNLGIGTNSPARPLDVNGSIRVANANAVEWGGTNEAIVGDTSGALIYKVGGSEIMRNTSTGLGIGTTTADLLSIAFDGNISSDYTAFDVDIGKASGSAITNLKGINVDLASADITGTDEITNLYGAYINNSTAGGSAGVITNWWGIYVPAADADRTDNPVSAYFGDSVGIGTTSPSSGMQIKGDNKSLKVSSADYDIGFLGSAGSGGAGLDKGYFYLKNAGTTKIQLHSDGDSYFNGGKVFIGSTSGVRGAEDLSIEASSDAIAVRTASAGLIVRKSSFTNGFLCLFETDGAVAVGSITSNGSTTAYNTSSDYRLKENVVNLDNALNRVAQLQPKRFNFISDADTTVDGFLAHEVSDIVPEAIYGEKDGVKEEEYEITPAVLDDDGNVVTEAVMGTREVPEYQGIDQSKLVPLLTKAIQEQQTIIEDLKTRIETLEG